ncbi:MAG: MFS transporter [Candidatus Thorarchaeota archaeon]
MARALGMEDAPDAGYRLAKIMAVLMPSYAMAFAISTTFWLVFIAEELGNGDYIAGLAQAGILVAIQLIIQTTFDYPTGTLGDRFGQRFIIASALCCYAAVFWLTAMVTTGSPYYHYIAIFALLGFGQSQESGAWGAWFDTNYQTAMTNDSDRKQYGVFQGKLGMLAGLATTLSLIPGSWIALVYSRNLVFQMQSVMCIIIALLVLRYVRDLPEVVEKRRTEDRKEDYIGLLKEGVQFVASNRFLRWFFLGEILIFSVATVYGLLILFPFYFTYLLNEVAVAMYRTFLYVPQVPLQERSGIWAKRFDPKKWIPRFRIFGISGAGFLAILGAITLTFPSPTESAEILTLYIPLTDIIILEFPVASAPALLFISILFISGFLIATVAGILTQRVLLDIIPNRIRNSVYSLRPTLIMIASLPMVIVFGEVIPRVGFPATFILLSIIALVGAILLRKAFDYHKMEDDNVREVDVPLHPVKDSSDSQGYEDE